MNRGAILALLCSGAFACGGVPKAGEPLIESVTTYNDGVRWDRLAVAASRVPVAEREDFIDERDELDDTVKITDWEIKRVSDDAPGHARVHVKYTWYAVDEGIVRHTQAVQSWERHGKAWLIVDERRTRGDTMPGLAEPEADDAAADPGDAEAADDSRAELR